jgi:hypothetical protein
MKKNAVGLTFNSLRDIPMKTGLHCMQIKRLISDTYINGHKITIRQKACFSNPTSLYMNTNNSLMNRGNAQAVFTRLSQY